MHAQRSTAKNKASMECSSVCESARSNNARSVKTYRTNTQGNVVSCRHYILTVYSRSSGGTSKAYKRAGERVGHRMAARCSSLTVTKQ